MADERQWNGRSHERFIYAPKATQAPRRQATTQPHHLDLFDPAPYWARDCGLESAAESMQGRVGMFSRRKFGSTLAGLSIALCAPPAAIGKARSRFAWPDAKRAAVSLTYDDGLDSQLANAAPQLEAHGFRGTFFLTEENMEARLDDWVALAERGHEIGDHTMTHPCELRPYDATRFQRQQLAPMEAFLDTHFTEPRPRLFAYPCGATELGARGSVNARRRAYERLMRRDFLAARIVDGGPNDPRLALRFRYLLQANAPTYDQDLAQPALDYVQRSIDRGYWAILIFHDVVDQRKYTGQTSCATHEAILNWIASQPVWCAPMRETFNYIQANIA